VCVCDCFKVQIRILKSLAITDNNVKCQGASVKEQMWQMTNVKVQKGQHLHELLPVFTCCCILLCTIAAQKFLHHCCAPSPAAAVHHPASPAASCLLCSS